MQKAVEAVLKIHECQCSWLDPEQLTPLGVRLSQSDTA